MRWVARLLAACVVLSAGMGAAQQAPSLRLALVIGNADYNQDGRTDTPNDVSDAAGFARDLQKPLNDAGDIAAALTRLHFDVTPLYNGTRGQMIAKIALFGQKVAAAGPDAVVVVYYAGHAMQVDGLNLLIPVGAKLSGDYDYRRLPAATTQEILAGETVSLPLIFNQFNDPDKGVNIVVLDSCRNNWWDAQVNGASRSVGASGGMSGRISTSRGAAEHHVDLGGTIIAFATQPGNVADDGAPTARNSPYTTALKANIEKPGLTVLQLFNTVALDVQTATRAWPTPQRPWNNGVTLPDVCLAGCGAPAATVEAAYWEVCCKDAGATARDFETYQAKVAAHALPGAFAEEAQTRLAALEARATAARAVPVGDPLTMGADNPLGSLLAYDVSAKRSLAEDRVDDLRHPGSLAKIMTLYLTFVELERGGISLSDTLTASLRASTQNPSKLGLRVGDTMSVEDAIRAIVIRTPNDVAEMLAEHLGGGDDAVFIAKMNATAHELGMTHTVYRNATGLPDADQVTTARDMVTLANALMTRFPAQYRYFNAPSFTYRGGSSANRNSLIDLVPGVDGMMSGYTAQSGYNALYSANRNGRRVTVAIFGAKTPSARTQHAVEAIEESYRR